MQTGVPAKPAANVAKLAPGFVPSFSLAGLRRSPLAATIAWAWLVRWRTGRHRAALWKTLVLPAGGAALCWLLVMTLWLPVLDYARSYAPQVRAIAERVGQPGCISELGLSRPQHRGAALPRPVQPAAAARPECSCPWLLVSPDAIGRLHDDRRTSTSWRLIGTLRRPTNASDNLLLYQRIAPAGERANGGSSRATPATVLVGQLAVMAFGVTDTIVAGRYAEEALAALSVGSAIFISVFVALMGVLQALLPVWAELHGAGRTPEVGRSVRQSLYLCGLAIVLGMAVLLFPGAAAALDRGAASHARRRRGLPARAGLRAAAGPAVPPVQHAEPEPGQAAARDLAAAGLARA